MAERTQIPASSACGLWETLLPDALDGLLRGADQRTFEIHMSICPACAALYEEARRGREWLEFLAPEPEIPVGLLEKLLATTGPGQETDFGLTKAASGAMQLPPAVFAAQDRKAPRWQQPGLMGMIYRFAEPRLMMTAATAFFSIALTLNLTGVNLSNLHLAELKPDVIRSTMERRLSTASSPFIRYYDHLRVAWEVESRMRELRRVTLGVEPAQKPGRQLPGETRITPKRRGARPDSPSHSDTPAHSEPDNTLEVSLMLQPRSAHSDGSATAKQERSTPWTA